MQNDFPSRASAQPGGQEKAAICLIVKNENPEIAEWVAHYTNIGANQLIIYDDGSDDGTRALLEKLEARFPITVIDWKTDDPQRQFAAYRDCLKRFGDQFDWIGFFDADEFLIPPPGARLSDLLDRHKEHDAFAINWLVYGSNGIAKLNGHSVMESFTERAAINFETNRHVKSFVRPSTVSGITNPHYLAGPEYFDVTGESLVEWDKPGITASESFVVDAWRLHHYVTRSGAHMDRRRARGDRHVNNEGVDNDAFFRWHDRNDVHDTTAVIYGEKARQRLIDEGFSNLFADQKSIEYSPQQESHESKVATIPDNLLVVMDEIANGMARGWVRNKEANAAEPLQLRFLVDGQFYDIVTCNVYRDDLARKTSYNPYSGFKFVVPDNVLDGGSHTLTVETLDGKNVTISRVHQSGLDYAFETKVTATPHNFYPRRYSGKMTSAVCLMVKNENPEIAEWVAHYTNLGFDQMIIYDDGSRDGTRQLLDRLAKKFPVTVIDWQRTKADSQQLDIYAECIKRFGAHYDWIGFFDTDEFLLPPPGETLADLLLRQKKNDAIAINWLVYGSNNIAKLNGNSIMASFTRHAEPGFSENQHVKIIVRPTRFTEVLLAHYFHGPQYADATGAPMQWQSPGVSTADTVKTDGWVLGHYVLRSLEHWERRVARGDPRKDGLSKATPAFFEFQNRNDIVDDRAVVHGEQARQTLIENGFSDLFAKTQPVEYIVDDQKPSLPAALPEPPPLTIIFDNITQGKIIGWVNDQRPEKDEPVHLNLFVDGELRQEIICDTMRPDIAKVGHVERSGFVSMLPTDILNGKKHTLVFETPDGKTVNIVHPSMPPQPSIAIRHTWIPSIQSNVDGFRDEKLSGWVLIEEDGYWAGGVDLIIKCDDIVIGKCIANASRPDVARAFSGDVKCGFDFVIPAAFRSLEPRNFHVCMADYPDLDLTGSPLRYNFAEQLLTDSPKTGTEGYALSQYGQWALAYQQALRRRTELADDGHEPNVINLNEPTISIICPVYKPDLVDFQAAVASVIRQTYQNWELILINDGSRDAALTHTLNAFAKKDKRIKIIKSPGNLGISGATNLGVDAARGEYVVLFDHDDLLVPVALQVMLKEARKTGALFLYSDEDKIDEQGRYSDPAFKPDFNLRLLRSVNYICHLVMIDRDVLRLAGRFSSSHDGAQDHDMFLRLAEITPPEKIVHVPDILYRWRISAGSTAGGTQAKPYTVEAGRRAVQDHYDRCGLPAKVSPMSDTTWYHTEWAFTEEPKVCIIIPFRNEIPMTKECVERVLDRTTYGNYEVILVDNGSELFESHQFAADIVKDTRVRVLRIDEPFNYSMLNNRAAAIADAAYLVLMNNDLHIHEGSWLRQMVNESLGDKKVGIVGGKWLYPDGPVQHAGTILGVGGVAGHIIGQRDRHEPGYGARAVLSQELSAVTAACMLINKVAFDSVGGLDQGLRVAFNDVDLCMKISDAGWKIIQAQYIIATHHESVSRGSDTDPVKRARFITEVDAMQIRWGKTLLSDRHYNPHFNLNGTPFSSLGDPSLPREYPPRKNPSRHGPGS